MAAIAVLAAGRPALAGDAHGKAGKGTKPVDIWQQETLSGDWGGNRTALKDRGLEFTIDYINEILANVSGGLKRGAPYQGRLEVSADADLEKLTGWIGATAHATVYQIHNINGRIGSDFVGSIGDPSNIDAYPTTRLFTAWFQQSAWGGKASIRVGQLAADDEFLTSTTASGLIGGTFGWANHFAANLPSGGPAYPLATPGVRVSFNPTDEISILTAAFSGNPAGSDCSGDPQVCDRYGLRFSFSGGVLAISELQYKVNQGKDATGLAASYKLGGWYHSGEFADQHYGVDAAGRTVSLADPSAVGHLQHQGNGGVYGVIDQMFWRSGPRSASFFLRAGVTSEARNLVPFYVDGGIGIKSPIAGRDDDVLTFGVTYSGISQSARDLDFETRAALGSFYPIRDYELQFELSYQAQIAPWWIIQPDLRYVVHPGGNVPDPSDPTNAAVRDALVVGVRSTLKF